MSVAAENVIGGILVGGRDAYWLVADMLRPEDFPTPRLASLYRLCGDIAQSDADLDVVTVGEEAERQGIIPMADLIELASSTPSAANIRGWAAKVKESALDRRFRAICAEGAKSGDRATVMAQITALFSDQPSAVVHIRAALRRMWDDVMARYEAGDEITGLRTGFPLVDEWTGGLQPGRGSVAIWSLEMSEEELTQRMVCAMAGVPSAVLQRPRLLDTYEEANPKLTAATARLRDAPLYICDRTDVTVEQIEAQARQMKANGHLDLLCVDYLGLLKLPKMERHDLAVAHATRRFKVIAKELRIPILLVFQLNRVNEHSGTVRPPRPSDARDSGAIEQDLDAMFLLHRPSYYDKGAMKGLRLDLALQRNGPTGLIRLEDELHCCRFTGGQSEWTDAKHSKLETFDL